ncbi:MAG: nuclear transport factor 2 family protein [Actinomycetota bacterium]|nr:nuclear transport factor 2 family protein [Actinomycetota bacterium]
MSQENVELVKALYPPPSADIAALFRDERGFEAMREGLSALLTDDFESVAVVLGQTRRYAGLVGLRQNWIDWLEPWATYRTTIDELIDAGERVVLLLRDYGRREGTDKEVEIIAASVCTVREGKLARWEDYPDRAAALEAAGLSE